MVHFLDTPRFSVSDQALLFRVIRAGFHTRRKKFINAVSEGMGIEKKLLGDILMKLGISADARAEEVSLEEFVKITNEMARGDRK